MSNQLKQNKENARRFYADVQQVQAAGLLEIFRVGREQQAVQEAEGDSRCS